MIELLSCPICSSGESRPFESLNRGGERVDYQLCKNCGAVYQSPRMSEQALAAYYLSDYVTDHQQADSVTEKELRVQAGRARHLVRLIDREVPAVARHLDIGSSTGKLMEATQAAYQCAAVGIEPAEVYRSYSTSKGLQVYRELRALTEAGAERFDLITMVHVLEHLSDPVGYLIELRTKWLSRGGVLVVEVPNLFGHYSLERPHLVCLHSATLRRALSAAGYRPRRIVNHGAPRSRLIPLYLTAIAESVPARGIPHVRTSPRGVLLRRRAGMAWHRLATRLLPNLAWLPLPELE
jgi:2-polyprenyl-3-methyl-5-hydroxy-6-metoxy-1,4-benzoquinol methylase